MAHSGMHEPEPLLLWDGGVQQWAPWPDVGRFHAREIPQPCACASALQHVRPCTQVRVMKRQEAISREMESAGEDMDRMQALLDELDKLNAKVCDGGCDHASVVMAVPVHE